jgi:hypothetical protein
MPAIRIGENDVYLPKRATCLVAAANLPPAAAATAPAPATVAKIRGSYRINANYYRDICFDFGPLHPGVRPAAAAGSHVDERQRSTSLAKAASLGIYAVRLYGLMPSFRLCYWRAQGGAGVAVDLLLSRFEFFEVRARVQVHVLPRANMITA